MFYRLIIGLHCGAVQVDPLNSWFPFVSFEGNPSFSTDASNKLLRPVQAFPSFGLKKEGSPSEVISAALLGEPPLVLPSLFFVSTRNPTGNQVLFFFCFVFLIGTPQETIAFSDTKSKFLAQDDVLSVWNLTNRDNSAGA